MQIRKGENGGVFAVFASNIEAERFAWIFALLLRRRVACFGQYDNAYQLV